MEDDLVYTTNTDQYFDYCLYPYKPITYTENKLKSINLLKNAIKYTSLTKEINLIIKKIQEEIGENKTVYGIKNEKGKISFELYFYNYNKKDPSINISRIKKILEPHLKISVQPNEKLNYFMFSIELTEKEIMGKNIEGIDVYFSGHGPFPTGPCYSLIEKKMKMKNSYVFFNTNENMIQIINKIKQSAFIDFQKINLNQIIIPELVNCKRICVSNKQENDCIYYSGLNINQLIFSLKYLDYPKEIINFIESNKNKLDHLIYDVGFDYVMEENKLKIIKSGYYGTF
jgi:hypothetical protein